MNAARPLSLTAVLSCLILTTVPDPSLSQSQGKTGPAMPENCLNDRERPLGTCGPATLADEKLDVEAILDSAMAERRAGWIRDDYHFVTKEDLRGLNDLGLYIRK